MKNFFENVGIGDELVVSVDVQGFSYRSDIFKVGFIDVTDANITLTDDDGAEISLPFNYTDCLYDEEELSLKYEGGMSLLVGKVS